MPPTSDLSLDGLSGFFVVVCGGLWHYQPDPGSHPNDVYPAPMYFALLDSRSNCMMFEHI